MASKFPLYKPEQESIPVIFLYDGYYNLSSGTGTFILLPNVSTRQCKEPAQKKKKKKESIQLNLKALYPKCSDGTPQIN